MLMRKVVSQVGCSRQAQADLSIYRDAGAEVVALLSRVSLCERASIDEVRCERV
jgi:hypothetical protein